VTNVVGDYTHSLNNAGDRLRLVSPLGEVVFDFRFDGQWEAPADGEGRSLVLSYEGSPVTELGQSGVWRASAFSGGSPGGPDPATVPNLALRLSRSRVGIRLELNAARARSYRIWSRSDLTTGDWRLEQNLGPAGSDGLRQVDLTPADLPQWYRVTSP
jgi:hypothetical protein